jgi:putative membrane protein
MKFSKVALGTMFVMLFAAYANVSFAKAKDHDGEIIAYMQAIDNHEINVSKVAKNKKVDADVMQFADMMITQHSDNLQQVTDISTKDNIAADETPAVKKFKENGDKGLATLSKLDDAKFQKAYINAMIKGHTDVNNMLMHFEKEVQNADLKQYLVDTKKAVEDHLAHAKKLK